MSSFLEIYKKENKVINIKKMINELINQLINKRKKYKYFLSCRFLN